MIVQDELDHYFQTLEKEDKFSGVVLITQGDLRLYAGAFGYASRSWKIPNNRRSPTLPGSPMMPKKRITSVMKMYGKTNPTIW
jgi:hypothetical protein